VLPGVVSHCIALVEHPEQVAQRIARFAEVVCVLVPGRPATPSP
jgi:methionine synthase II (cobalamin-independent)